jgi:hypothetical protein
LLLHQLTNLVFLAVSSEVPRFCGIGSRSDRIA